MLFNDTKDIDSLRMGTFNFVSMKFTVVVIIIVQKRNVDENGDGVYVEIDPK